jgi:GTP-binding protein
MNKIAGHMFAVTSPVEGTTRDRQYVDSVWNGVDFTLVDTAGITFDGRDELEKNVRMQIEIAIEEADMLWLVVDGKQPVRSMDQKALLKFRKSSKPVMLLINKVDSVKKIDETVENFKALGIKNLFAISATNGRGFGDMLDFATDYLKKNVELNEKENKASGIAVSIVGKPNVGKSSLFNKIINEERVVVSEIPGTTRTAIDTTITYKDQTYTFIDTAGLKKKTDRQALPDIFSGFQTFKAIRRSDVCLLLTDATVEVSKQDQQIAQEILKLGKSVILVANKYDIYKGTEQDLRDYFSFHFQFVRTSPLFFISAKTGDNIDEMLSAIEPIYNNRNRTASQEELDKLLAKKMKKNPPILIRDQKQPKVFGLKQLDTNPPLFELYVNFPAAISKQFRDSVKNGIIEDLGFWGVPVNLRLRGKDKK